MIGESQLGNVLIYGAIPMFAIYLYAFQQAVGGLPASEQSRLVSDASLPVWRRVVGIMPIPLILLVSSSSLRMALAVWLAIQLVVDTREHQQKLAASGFDSNFRGRLQRATMLSGIAFAMFTFGMVLRGV